MYRNLVYAAVPLTLAGTAVTSAQPAVAPPPDTATMSRAALESEIAVLRALAANGAVVQQRPTGCTAPENRQFDFWLGEWDVSSTGTTALVAESSITLADQGCTILEHWRPFQGASGHSINGYDAAARQWKQTWIDATGRITPYAGTLTGGTLTMDDLGPQPRSNPKFTKNRMNFRAVNANTVRQWGEGWDGEKRAWVVTWDLTYRRRIGTGTGRP